MKNFLLSKVDSLLPLFQPIQNHGAHAEHLPQVSLFLSLSDGQRRAFVCHASSSSAESAWADCLAKAQALIESKKLELKWLRLDRVTSIAPIQWAALSKELKGIKRNYYRFGLALDPQFKIAFLEQEINGNGLLYLDKDTVYPKLNLVNFEVYSKRRYGSKTKVSIEPEQTVFQFATEAWFFSDDARLANFPLREQPCYLPAPSLAGNASWLNKSTLYSGRREFDHQNPEHLVGVFTESASYLANQVNEDGSFTYGHFPCFGRLVSSYNNLRHASSLYAMIEAWEFHRDDFIYSAIKRALYHLTQKIVRLYPQPDGSTLAYNVDVNGEIKLGANAVTILALVKYTELTGDTQFMDLMTQLALGIQRMQNPETGGFVHVLNEKDLTLKEPFRIVYYDGEAAFGLMRLYGLTRDPRWLAIVEKAFEYFIANDHWKHHDHWLSYAVNELTIYSDNESYYKFGIQNIAEYLDFILDRETTFPTLLELAMAFQKMVMRIESKPHLQGLLTGIDLPKFQRALHHRASYLLNGFFWPEVAMFFAKPSTILGGFYIRHHSFRVRIDDVEHYLSGLIAYWQLISGQISGKTVLPLPSKPANALPPLRGVQAGEQIAGLLIYPLKPLKFAEANAIAQASARKGIKIFYFSYKNNVAGTHLFAGHLFEDGQWKPHTMKAPLLIDNAPPRTKSEADFYRELNAKSFMTCHKLGGKGKTTSILAASPTTSGLLLETTGLSVTALSEALDTFGQVVVKPYRSSRGRNIFVLRQSPGQQVEIQTDEATLTGPKAEMIATFTEGKSSKLWMIQRYFQSVDENAFAFDIRVPLFRHSPTEWQVARMYARKGAGPVTSNLATGGVAVAAREFLLTLYNAEQTEQILHHMESSSKAIAEVLQKSYPFMIDAIGCDFGIKDGVIKLFEVNSYPGIKGCLLEAAEAKASYYASLLPMLREAPIQPATNTTQSTAANAPTAQTAACVVHTQVLNTDKNKALFNSALCHLAPQGSNPSPKANNPRSFKAKLLSETAQRLGWTVVPAKRNYVELYKNGSLCAVVSTEDLGLSVAASMIVETPMRWRAVMLKAGLPVAPMTVMKSVDELISAVSEQGGGYLRPAEFSRKLSSTIFPVGNEQACKKAWDYLSKISKGIIYQSKVPGDQVRFITLNGKVVSAHLIVPFFIVGDGIRTVEALLQERQAQRHGNPWLKVNGQLESTALKLWPQAELNRVPKAGEFASLRAGSQAVDLHDIVCVGDMLHPAITALVERAACAISGAAVLGINVAAEDFGADPGSQKVHITNILKKVDIASPHYPTHGVANVSVIESMLNGFEEQASRYSAQGKAENASLQASPVYEASCRGDAFPRNYGIQLRLLRHAGYVNGLELERLDGHVTLLSDGHTECAFGYGMSDRTLLVARRASNDKDWTKNLLSRHGLNVPKGDLFKSTQAKEAWEFACELGLPVVLKPIAGSGGSGVSTNVNTRERFVQAWDFACATKADEIIVEQYFIGQDYRVVVLDNAVISTVQRLPAHVDGDGLHTIDELIAHKNKGRANNPHHAAKPMRITEAMSVNLKDMGLNADSVPKQGERIFLHTVANIGTGGEAIDVTEQVHPDWAAVMVQVRRAIYNPLHVGIDLIAGDITQSPSQQSWTIVEVNTNPDFGANHFPLHGQGRDVAGDLLRHLFQARAANSAVRVVAHGKVQGVGFRKWIWQQAHLHGLSGHVQNLSDGSVEACFSGNAYALTNMLQVIRTAYKGAKVSSLHVESRAFEPATGFEVIPS